MRDILTVLFKDYGWIHTGLGLGGNIAFLVGSILFLPAFEPWQTIGVWLFIVGASLMLVGAAGDLSVKLLDRGH